MPTHTYINTHTHNSHIRARAHTHTHTHTHDRSVISMVEHPDAGSNGQEFHKHLDAVPHDVVPLFRRLMPRTVHQSTHNAQCVGAAWRWMGVRRERQHIAGGRRTWRWMMMESSGHAAMINKTMHRKINSSTPGRVEDQSVAHGRRRRRAQPMRAAAAPPAGKRARARGHTQGAAHLVSSCSTR